MSKLSATTPIIDSEEIPRTELTPESIKNMTDEELNAWLVKLRGNREVTSSQTKSKGSARVPKEKRDILDDVEFG